VPPLRQIVPGRQARCIRVAPNEGQPHI